MMVLVDAGAHCKHVQVIRCVIKYDSIEKCRDFENKTISEKIQGVKPLVPIFQTPKCLFDGKKKHFKDISFNNIRFIVIAAIYTYFFMYIHH
jgi:hypothetical protein